MGIEDEVLLNSLVQKAEEHQFGGGPGLSDDEWAVLAWLMGRYMVETYEKTPPVRCFT